MYPAASHSSNRRNLSVDSLFVMAKAGDVESICRVNAWDVIYFGSIHNWK
jgi:hypothetical protein